MIENQLNELIAALKDNTAALRDVLAKAGSPAPAPVEPKPAKVKKEKPSVESSSVEALGNVVSIAATKPAAAAEAEPEKLFGIKTVSTPAEESEPADDLDTTEAIAEETRTPEQLRLAITETVKAALTAADAIPKNAKGKWEKIRTDHGIGKLAEATDDQLPSILAAVEAL